MNYAAIKKFDVANGPGVRVSLFVSGCTLHCKNCFNSEAWDFNYGNAFTEETEEEIIKALSPDFIKGFSLLGGEPFEPRNQETLKTLLRRIKAVYPNKEIWCYTGNLLDADLLSPSRMRCEHTDEMLSYIDVLIDGRFVEEKKDLKLRFRGSSNQRIIDVKRTLAEGKVVPLAGNWYLD